MTTPQGTFVSRDEYRRQRNLDEARRQGKIPAALDEEGNEINPHMPQYIIHAPWYLNYNGPSLKHQRIREELEKTKLETWYPRGLKGSTQTKYVKGACSNCGATTHVLKDCCDRPRIKGAQFTGRDIKPDDIVVSFDGLNYDEKRDRWNGYDPDNYRDVILEHSLFEQMRRAGNTTGEKKLTDEYRTTIAGENQTQITSRDPRTKTMTRNLRIREDQANYLLNLDTNSAYFDPKSRSLRDNPNPHLPEEKQAFKGLNAVRNTGDAVKLYQQELFAWEHSEKNNLELNTVALPTLTEIQFKAIKQRKEKQKIGRTGGLIEKYGGEEHLEGEMDLILGQTDRYVEYNEAGQPINNKKKDATKSKYPEDVFYNDHLSVWGSWWNETLGWGYECCNSNEKHSVCLGDKGKRLAMQKEYKIRKELQDEAFKKEKKLELDDDISDKN